MLVIRWENLVLAVEKNYDASPLTETIQDILDLKELAIEDFQNLHKAADAFNKAILAANWNFPWWIDIFSPVNDFRIPDWNQEAIFNFITPK